jgi:hypothetical protein
VSLVYIPHVPIAIRGYSYHFELSQEIIRNNRFRLA